MPVTTDIRNAVIVVMESKNYSDIIGSSAMPYLNSLAAKYGLAANFYANGIDSLPNYFMLTVGDTVSANAAFTGR